MSYRGYVLVGITGEWGFATVPAEIRDLAVEVVCSWLGRNIQAAVMGEGPYDGGALPPHPAAAYDLPAFAKRRLRRWKTREPI